MSLRTTRRSFLRSTVSGVAAAVFISRVSRNSRAGSSFNPDFATATETLQAIQRKDISCRELLERVYSRIGKCEPRINAFVTLNEEEARKRAQQADDQLAGKEVLGRLHGLPIVIKDSYQTAGLRTTSGFKPLENHVPEVDAVGVARLRAEGAVIIGKTNLPLLAGDIQSFNEIAGTTNNPWDLKRTPGGSTGGGAAALAAGCAYLELGSDIGGSIRTPSSFCGIYGHKPTADLVPMAGHIPPLPDGIRALSYLPVSGPMARSAEDIRMELEIIGGPTGAASMANTWKLPRPRHAALKDYRIGYVLDDPFCRVTAEVRKQLTAVVQELGKAGVQLVPGWPKGVNPHEQWENYLRLLSAFYSLADKEEELEQLRQMTHEPHAAFARLWLEGNALSHQEWLAERVKREKARLAWQDYFRTHDAFLMPVNFAPAFPHDHSENFFARTITTSAGDRPYGDMLKWISFATLTGCPATSAPAGPTDTGLPVGIQIMGPLWEDATPIDIADRLGKLIGGFVPPPGFASH